MKIWNNYFQFITIPAVACDRILHPLYCKQAAIVVLFAFKLILSKFHTVYEFFYARIADQQCLLFDQFIFCIDQCLLVRGAVVFQNEVDLAWQDFIIV